MFELRADLSQTQDAFERTRSVELRYLQSNLGGTLVQQANTVGGSRASRQLHRGRKALGRKVVASIQSICYQTDDNSGVLYGVDAIQTNDSSAMEGDQSAKETQSVRRPSCYAISPDMPTLRHCTNSRSRGR